jgi:hypothetical protein
VSASGVAASVAPAGYMRSCARLSAAGTVRPGASAWNAESAVIPALAETRRGLSSDPISITRTPPLSSSKRTTLPSANSMRASSAPAAASAAVALVSRGSGPSSAPTSSAAPQPVATSNERVEKVNVLICFIIVYLLHIDQHGTLA